MRAISGELLQKISGDPDNFGFALAAPNDYGAACIVYAVGKNSASGPFGNLSRNFIYTPVEWVQNWTGMPRTNEALDEIVERFRETYSAMEDGEEKNQSHTRRAHPGLRLYRHFVPGLTGWKHSR